MDDDTGRRVVSELARIDRQLVGLLTGRLDVILAHRHDPAARAALGEALARTPEAWSGYAEHQCGATDIARLMGEHARHVYENHLRTDAPAENTVIAMRDRQSRG